VEFGLPVDPWAGPPPCALCLYGGVILPPRRQWHSASPGRTAIVSVTIAPPEAGISSAARRASSVNEKHEISMVREKFSAAGVGVAPFQSFLRRTRWRAPENPAGPIGRAASRTP